MKKSELRKAIKEQILKEMSVMSGDQIIDALSEISITLADIQKQILKTNPELVDKLSAAKDNIQDVQNALDSTNDITIQ